MILPICVNCLDVLGKPHFSWLIVAYFVCSYLAVAALFLYPFQHPSHLKLIGLRQHLDPATNLVRLVTIGTTAAGPFSSQRVKPSVLTLAPTRNRSMEKGDNPHCSLMIWSAKASGSGRVQLLSERQGAGLSPVLTPPPLAAASAAFLASWVPAGTISHPCRRVLIPSERR